MANTITYTINLNGTLHRGVIDLAGAAQQATRKVDRLFVAVNKAANVGFVIQHAAAAIQRVSAAMSGAVEAHNAQVVAERQLEQVMQNTIGASKEEVQSILDLASAQQKLGVIGDEVQLAGAKELATYVTKADSLKKLMPMVNDMLAHQYGLNASQEQAVQIAQMVGKVLDGQVGALSRAGYRFDEAQEKILKFGEEEQRVALLSDIVTQYVGGVNAALAATPEGKLKQQANTMGDLRERVGGLFVAVQAALTPLTVAVGSALERLILYFEKNREAIMQVVDVVANVLGSVLSVLGGVLKGVWTVLSGVFSTLRSLLPVITAVGAAALTFMVATNAQLLVFAARFYAHIALAKAAAIATKLWAAAQALLNTAMRLFLANPIAAAIAVAIAAVIGAAIAFKKYNAQQHMAAKLTGALSAKIGVEQREVDRLFEALKKTNPQSEERKRLLQEMNEKYPHFLGNQNLEKSNEEELEAARKKANDELARTIALQEIKDKREEVTKKISAAQQALFEKLSGKLDAGQINEALNKIEEASQKVAADGKFKPGVFGGANNGLIVQTLTHTFQKATDSGELYADWDFLGAAFSEMKALMDESLTGYHALGSLQNFAQARYGLTNAQLAGAVNGNPLKPGGVEPAGAAAASEAIATGGTRSTTVNISLGSMIENVIFQGATRENRSEIERSFAEALMRTLGMAETSIG